MNPETRFEKLANRLLDFVSYRNYRHNLVLALSSLVAFCVTAGISALVFDKPEEAVTTTSVVVTESSRTVSDSTMAVVELVDGTREWLNGQYIAGDVVTVGLDANGGIVADGAITVYWVAMFSLGLIGGMIGFFIALVGIDKLEIWRDRRRLRRHHYAYSQRGDWSRYDSL